MVGNCWAVWITMKNKKKDGKGKVVTGGRLTLGSKKGRRNVEHHHWTSTLPEGVPLEKE